MVRQRDTFARRPQPARAAAYTHCHCDADAHAIANAHAIADTHSISNTYTVAAANTVGTATLTGSRLHAVTKVNLTGPGGKRYYGSGIVVAAGGGSLTFTVPRLPVGDYTVTVTSPAGTSGAGEFGVS